MNKNVKLPWIAKGKRIPLWKWLLIIILVLALPLFFSFYRNVQIEQALGPSTRQNQ